MVKYRINKAKFIYFILLVIGIIFLAWLTISWGEVIVKNANDNIIYSDWNLFTLILNYS